MIRAARVKFNGLTTPISSYDQNKTNLGSLIKQYSGATNEDFYAGPARIGMARPMEAATSIACAYPHVISKTNTVDWVFLAENGTAVNTRRVVMYEYNKDTSAYNWMGFITLTYPTATATIRALRMVNEYYTTGTVGVSGTAVTGTGTLWVTDRMSVGSRIGFGSTDPNFAGIIWREIVTIVSNTSITLDTSVTVSPGTAYVIQDLMCLTVTTNATTTNGGLYVTKGLRPELFNSVGTTIPAAVSTDNIRAVYWLSETATSAIITASSCGIQARTSWTNANCYIIILGVRIFVFNFRRALTVASGKDLTAFVLATGTQAVTGTLSQANNGRVGTLNHNVSNGIESFFFVTTTRVYRCAISTILNGSTTFLTDAMVETPPGGVSTYPATNALNSIEIAGDIDRLIIISTGAAGVRSYVTDYRTDSAPFLHIFLNDDKQLDQSIADSGGVLHPSILVLPFSVWSENGVMHMCRISTVSATNQMYSLPIGAHQTYAFANQQLLISPRVDISGSTKLYNFNPNNIQRLGTDTFSLPLEPFKMYYRTSGISDNTGGWNLLDQTGDLSGVSGTEIQFAFIFKILATTCIPGRITGFNLTYEDSNTDSHYEPSVGSSSIANRRFAYRQSDLWSSVIPNMRIRLYNASSGSLLIDDNVISSAFGVFEYSTNGGTTWLAWNSSSDIVGNYIRYTATSLPDGIRVRSLLTQV